MIYTVTPAKKLITHHNIKAPTNRYYLIMTFLLFYSITVPTPADILLESNWESGEYESYGWATSGNPTALIVSAPEPVCKGKYSSKFTLNFNDPVSFRTQLTLNSGPMKEIKIGQEYWFSFNVYLPASYSPDSALESVFDLHARPDKHLNEDWRNAVIAIRTKDDSWVFSYSHDEKELTPPTETGVEFTRRNITLSKFQTGKWTNFVIHTKYTYKPEGYVDLWIDGQLAYSLKGGVGFNDTNGPYVKIGIYKRMWDLNKTWGHATEVSSRLVYIDEVRIDDANSSLEEIGVKCSLSAPTGLQLQKN